LSLHGLSAPWLAYKPVVHERPGFLEARTSLLSRLVCLFAYDRRLSVRHAQRLLTLVVRRWCVAREVHEIRFSNIEYLSYGFGRLPIDMGYTSQGGFTQNQVGAVVTNEVDRFNIAVKVRETPEPLLLFRFLGHGGLASQALSLLTVPFSALRRLWAIVLRVITLEGDEEQRSLELATSLSLLIGVPLSSPTEEDVRRALHMVPVPCPECGRSIQRHAPKCVHCSAKFPNGVADTVSG
jgi:hypothetical protein